MKITKQARREAKALLRACLKDGQLDETRVRQVVQQVLEQKPRGFLAILSHFQRLVKIEVIRRTARVESATALDSAVRAEVERSLTRAYGPGLKLEFAENPGLIGGMRVQVGSDVYDGSVDARLKALADSF